MSPKKENTIMSYLQVIGRLNKAQLALLVSITLALFSGFGFVLNTKATNKEIPLIKENIEDHERKDDAKYFLIVNALNEIKLGMKDIQGDVKIVNTKVDDMKAYGVGEYHKATKEAIKKAE